MNTTFRQLRLFLALAEAGSVTGAAKRIHVTQSTASDQLREITQNVGAPLYEVISKRVYLTDVGRELAQTARRIVDEWECFEQHMDARRGLTRGRLKIAAVSTAKYFVPRLVGEFCQLHPDIDVSIEILNRDGVVERLRDNRDEVYVMSMPPTDMDLADHIFMTNPLVLISAESYLSGGDGRISRAELQAARFILREQGSGTRMACDRWFASQRLTPQVRMELGSNEAIKEAVAGGLGLGIVSTHALPKTPKSAGLKLLHMKGLPIHSQWHLVYPRTRQLSYVARAFVDRLLNQP